MNNQEWKKLQEAYQKESNRRHEIKWNKQSAERLKNIIKAIVAEKDRIEKIDIDIPGRDWWNGEHRLILDQFGPNYDGRLIRLFIDCLDSFIPYLDELINVDIETGEVKKK